MSAWDDLKARIRREREAFAHLRAQNPLAWKLGLQALIVIVLIVIAWPLALLAAVLYALGYAKPYAPERAWRFPLRASLVPLALLVVALTYPLYNGSLGTMRILGDFPGTDTAVIMCVYAMMAVGLNIVVGYAGLLDLGYVAFYAMGAYTAAWLASVQFPQVHFNLGGIGVASGTAGIHLSVWVILL